jgi:NAD-dependent SIR2 family protein deacetylase
MHDLITQHGKLSTKKCSLCGDRLLYEIEYEPGVTFTACHHCDVEMAKRA